MFRGAAKKFFWSIVGSSVLMILVQVTPLGGKFRGTLTDQLKGLQGQSKRAIASAADEVKEYLPTPEARGGILTTEELKDTLGEKESISKSSNEYIIDDEQYVLINGQYFKARKDNTYMVNGEKVFYVSNRSRRGKEAPATEEKSDIVESPNFNMPTTPQEMMETMQQAQENMKRRNQMLKEIDETM